MDTLKANLRCACFRSWRTALLVLGIATAALLALDGLFGLLVTLAVNNEIDKSSSYTIREAERKGTLVARLAASPTTVDWHGHRITVNEAWVEHKARRLYTVVIIPFVLDYPICENLPGYYLAMNLKEGGQAFKESRALFVRPGRGASFAERWERGGPVLFWDEIDDPDNAPFVVQLTDNWRREGAKELVLTPAGE